MGDSEKLIEDAILKWLNLQFNCFAFKQDVRGIWDQQRKFYRKANKWTPKGGSDILVCFQGRFISLEVKTPATHKRFFTHPGSHELRQQEFMKTVQRAGGLAYVVSSLIEVQTLFTSWLHSNSVTSIDEKHKE